MVKKDNTNLYKKLDELEDIIRENTILIKKNRALVSINHDNLHGAYRESYDVTRELLLLQLERARKFIVQSQNKKDVSMASSDEVKNITGFSIGGVSPTGHLVKIKIFIDENLKNFSSIYAAAGHPNAVFEIDFENLKALTSGEIKEITE